MSPPPAISSAAATTATSSSVVVVPQDPQTTPIPRPQHPFDPSADDDPHSVPTRPLHSTEAPEDLRLLYGQANEFKEGDEALGVSAPTPAHRLAARLQLSTFRLGDISPARFDAPADSDPSRHSSNREPNEARIREIMPGLRSEVIAGVVKLMSNEELIKVASKIWNPVAKGRSLGTRGVFASRIQPNSATDDPEEVLMSILEGLSYGCGDAIFGINIVASDLPNVATLESILLDVIQTFKLESATRHCVLAHIEEQMAVHANRHLPLPPLLLFHTGAQTAHTVLSSTPGSSLVRVAFQSIGGTTAVNRVFGVTVDSLLAHARSIPVSSTTGLYFETGQGSAVTNNAAHGIDMVTCESRAHGLARALRRATGHWCIVNTVAGFIGPEVFKTRAQLVRACLEDVTMGKLHGLTFGLDICSTYHMGCTLDDMQQVQDEVLRAGPGFYMSVAGRNDPMLSYITTGFRDHPRLRETFGVRGTDEMRGFFADELGVMDAEGRMTSRAGDTEWVYVQYRKRKGDQRSEDELRAEARTILAKLQARGMDLGYGHDGAFGPPAEVKERLQAIYEDAKRAVRLELDVDRVHRSMRAQSAREPEVIALETTAHSRDEYLAKPTTGESLAPHSLAALRDVSRRGAVPSTQGLSRPPPARAVIILGDGLNADAVHESGADLVAAIQSACAQQDIDVHPTTLLVRNARVRVGYQIGHELFAQRATDDNVVLSPDQLGIVFLIVGERPGNGNNTMSVYQVAAGADKWASGRVDHCDARVVSGISNRALRPLEAAQECLKFVEEALVMAAVEKGKTGGGSVGGIEVPTSRVGDETKDQRSNAV
ncbi:ethanolamine ammonia lyase large subunit-domain-containing protein [Catenaria anguillulae PL171]|uniref:Ethanolamine ammonia lyase large subunit-domain-containing protein n=1 Tax=Catenaria anguillulae PL171 TaxID=765915 RepID=A0A1Y2HNY6_9FUNG|nr:ethanolamine ammonia lyase large subunit-domain-containing protein [Catenaria anguillulae PL171]